MIRQFVPFLTLAAAGFAASAPPVSGLWDATIKINDLEIPFRFEISAASPAKATGSFFNGDERITSTSGRFASDHLILDFAHYAAKLDGKFENGQFVGTYKRGDYPAYVVRAHRYTAPAETSEK